MPRGSFLSYLHPKYVSNVIVSAKSTCLLWEPDTHSFKNIALIIRNKKWIPTMTQDLSYMRDLELRYIIYVIIIGILPDCFWSQPCMRLYPCQHRWPVLLWSRSPPVFQLQGLHQGILQFVWEYWLRVSWQDSVVRGRGGRGNVCFLFCF